MERASAVLGYPQEHSSPLAADHHGVCKFANDTDEKYICVKGVLKMIRSKVTSEIVENVDSSAHFGKLLSNSSSQTKGEGANENRSSTEVAKELQAFLGVSDSAEIEFSTRKAQKMEGSCQWLAHKQSFQNWFGHAGPDYPILVLTGPPATGKSTIASFVVEWIRNLSIETTCHHYFFVSNHQVKRSVSYCLRLLAFQLAMKYAAVREALFRLKDENSATFGQQSSKTIWEKIFQGIILRTPLQEDLYWVFDALDESDTPSALYDMLLKIRSKTPIKIFITSRETRELSNVVYNYPEKVIREPLTPADTYQDIRECVNTTIRANLPHDRENRDKVVEQILAKANGSFLWVKLTLETIRDSWHTQEDIRKAMQDIPEGMEPLYAGMLNNVKQQNPRKLAIAKAILTWTVCSFRPLRLSELQAALAPAFGEFLSLEETVSQVCGNFVRVTNGEVSLVHITGRHFLLNRSLGFVDMHESHRKLALACLRYISDDNWRHIFALGPKNEKVNEEYPLLLYATHHWAYHVQHSVCTCDELWTALDTFFNSHVLVWIHGLAISSSLQTLIRTAQDLRYFAHRHARMQADTNEPPLSLRTHDTQWLRSWAIDLIRIVGKFGRALLQNPLSIYQLIPIFSPSQSQISVVYGGRSSQGISLAGISSSVWDDCIARVSGVEDETISRVLSTETTFVTLISTRGKAIVWSSETCAESRSIHHNEYVTHMAINRLGTTLATAGIRTIRLWELSSGKEVDSFPANSEAKTMTIAFGHSDNILIIAREDFSIRFHDLSSKLITSTFWACPRIKTGMNGPRFMTISPDLTKVAVAERGKPVFIWDLERSQDQQPWRCVRHTDRLRDTHEQEAWTASEVVCWLPEGTSILILYQGSGIVHWSFTEDSQKEYSHIEGREMVLTKDANFLLTSDPSGTLYVWALPRFNLIYKLFYEDIVRDLAFSPDGQRIYDSRGAICNVWEPDVLIRHEDTGHDDTSSNQDGNAESSILSEPVICENDSTISQVTALVSDPDDQYYCCGRDDGSVIIHSSNDGSKVRKISGHSNTVSIIALEWSKSGRYIVSGDDAGRIICKRLELKDIGKWAVFPVFDIRAKDLVRQFLFHPNESSLLISTKSSDLLWSIRGKSKKETCRKNWPSFVGRRWILCPDNVTKLLWVGPCRVAVFQWESLELCEPQPSIPTQAVETKSASGAARPPLIQADSYSAETVRCVSATRNGRHLIAEIVPDTGYSCSLAPRNLKIQHLPAFSSSSPFQNNAEQWITLTELSQQTSRLLGIFNDRVLFLDATFWVCTWEMTGMHRAKKRHFFLPRDWISPASLQLVTYNEHGTVFCPRNGEVAIVKNGIKT